jgi:hypothetical protein
VDLSALTQPGDHAGTRFGQAHLTGRWQGGQLTVTDQSAPVASPPPPPPDDMPCEPPAGGWLPNTQADRTALRQYVVAEHPDQFRQPRVSYPSGVPAGGVTPIPTTEVLVIEMVSGDLDAARAELRRRYTGNLCVTSTPGLPSIADQDRLQADADAVIGPLMREQANGIYAMAVADKVSVDLVMLTPRLADAFAVLLASALDARPWLAPVH